MRATPLQLSIRRSLHNRAIDGRPIDLGKHVKAETPLYAMNLQSGRQPISIAAGFLDHGKTQVGSRLVAQWRKLLGEIGWGAPIAVQVVVVLTAEWTVLCYDHQLKLLWESNPTDHRVAGTVHREVLCVSLRNAPRVPVACSIGPDYP